VIAADKKVVIERVSFSLPHPSTTYRDRGLANTKAVTQSLYICP